MGESLRFEKNEIYLDFTKFIEYSDVCFASTASPGTLGGLCGVLVAIYAALCGSTLCQTWEKGWHCYNEGDSRLPEKTTSEDATRRSREGKKGRKKPCKLFTSHPPRIDVGLRDGLMLREWLVQHDLIEMAFACRALVIHLRLHMTRRCTPQRGHLLATVCPWPSTISIHRSDFIKIKLNFCKESFDECGKAISIALYIFSNNKKI